MHGFDIIGNLVFNTALIRIEQKRIEQKRIEQKRIEQKRIEKKSVKKKVVVFFTNNKRKTKKQNYEVFFFSIYKEQ